MNNQTDNLRTNENTLIENTNESIKYKKKEKQKSNDSSIISDLSNEEDEKIKECKNLEKEIKKLKIINKI